MSQKLATILKTDVMSGLPLQALAEIVRRSGRGRDTVLAHITPREAKKLKKEGGSGTTNPDTGLPEYDDGIDFGGDFSGAGATDNIFSDVSGQMADIGYTPVGDIGSYPGFGEIPQYAPGAGQFGGEQGVQATVQPGAADTQNIFEQIRTQMPDISTMPQEPTEEQGFGAKLGEGITKAVTGDPLRALGLGLGGAATLFNLQRQQQQAKAQRGQALAAAQQMRDIAAPVTQPALQNLAMSRQGALGPEALQAYQIAQARAAQGAARSGGGVGAAQMAAEMGRLYNTLLQQQETQAINQYTAGSARLADAIRLQLQAYQSKPDYTNTIGMFSNLLSAVGSARRTA